MRFFNIFGIAAFAVAVLTFSPMMIQDAAADEAIDYAYKVGEEIPVAGVVCDAPDQITAIVLAGKNGGPGAELRQYQHYSGSYGKNPQVCTQVYASVVLMAPTEPMAFDESLVFNEEAYAPKFIVPVGILKSSDNDAGLTVEIVKVGYMSTDTPVLSTEDYDEWLKTKGDPA